MFGYPSPKPAELSLDVKDDVVKSDIIDTEPFKVTYKNTIKSEPDISNLQMAQNLSSNLLDHITISDVQAYWALVFTAKPKSTKDSHKSDKSNQGKRLPEFLIWVLNYKYTLIK